MTVKHHPHTKIAVKTAMTAQNWPLMLMTDNCHPTRHLYPHKPVIRVTNNKNFGSGGHDDLPVTYLTTISFPRCVTRRLSRR